MALLLQMLESMIVVKLMLFLLTYISVSVTKHDQKISQTITNFPKRYVFSFSFWSKEDVTIKGHARGEDSSATCNIHL